MEEHTHRIQEARIALACLSNEANRRGAALEVLAQLDQVRQQVDWLARRLDALAVERDTLRAKVYVPGHWRCPKCELYIVSNIMTGHTVAANNEPQRCPNDCGPMWRVTYEDLTNELQERLDQSETELARTRELLDGRERLRAQAESRVDRTLRAAKRLLARRMANKIHQGLSEADANRMARAFQADLARGLGVRRTREPTSHTPIAKRPSPGEVFVRVLRGPRRKS